MVSETDQTYQGWANHATWCVALHLANTESAYHAYRACQTAAQLRLLCWQAVERGYRLSFEASNWERLLLVDLTGEAYEDRPYAPAELRRRALAALETVDWSEVLAHAHEE